MERINNRKHGFFHTKPHLSSKKLKYKWYNLSLRKAFVYTVLFSVSLIFLLSVATVSLCLWGRKAILPDSNGIYLTLEKTYEGGSYSQVMYISLENDKWEVPVTVIEEGTPDDGNDAEIRYFITKIEKDYTSLSPKRKFVYRFLSVSMILLPIIYATYGIFLCALWFYKHKLSKPISQLEYATGQIKLQNLDFEIKSYGTDELGRLCSSFENMRSTLYKNNRSMWNMFEERKRLQASVSHDLRNPITIIQTYTDFLCKNLSNDSLTKEQLLNIAQNLNITSKRLEQYTNSIHNISKLEEIEIHPETVNLAEILPEMHEELSLLADKNDKKLIVNGIQEDLTFTLDVSVLYRILENLVNNSARYAKEKIIIEYIYSKQNITIIVSDDGTGYPKNVLSGAETFLTSSDANDGHMGLGLAICRILCNKSNGTIKFYNNKEGGATAKIILKT